MIKQLYLTLFFLAILCLLPYATNAQNNNFKTSIDSTDVYYFTGSLMNLSFNNLSSIDTNLLRFQHYDVSFKKNNYYITLGNIGLPSKNIVFDAQINEGFNYRNSSLDLYTYTFDKSPYFYLIKPYTEATYVSGPAREQRIQLIHSQNIAPRLNISLKTIFINSPGLYNKQKADDKNVSFSTYYTTKNQRYAIAANYVHDKFHIEESGGIKYDSVFRLNIQNNRRQVEMNLEGAKNTVINGGISIQQYLNIGRPPYTITNDSTESTDSIQETTPRKGFRFGRISHHFKYYRTKVFFEDATKADTSFFQPFGEYLNTTLTMDSVNIKTIENEFMWSNLDYDKHPENKTLYFYLGLKQRWNQVTDTLNSTTNNELIPKAGFSLYLMKKFRLNADGYYVIGDHNNGDKYLSVTATQKLRVRNKDFGQIKLQAIYKRQSPDWFYNYYSGNVFRWENDFNKENISIVSAEYNNKNLRVGAKYTSISNHIYLGPNASPLQLDGSANITQGYLNYLFSYNKWDIDFNLFYQQSSSESIHLPKLTANVGIYFTQKFLQNVALLQPGVEIFYNTAYLADAYMPMHRSFYLQSTQTLGNYMYVDLFLNVRIKRTLFFIKYQHANAGYMGYDYMMVPSYPMHDTGIKFGLSWKFYD